MSVNRPLVFSLAWLCVGGGFGSLACSKSSESPPGSSSGGSGQSSATNNGGRTGGGAGGGVAAGGAGGASMMGTGGAGASSGGSGGAASASGGSRGDTGGAADGNRDTGSVGETGVDGGGGPAAALNGFLFQIPCPLATAGGNCNVPIAMRAKMTTLSFGGDPNVTYKVTLHFCGPIEMRPYSGCTAMQAMYMCVDGVAATAGFNATYPTYGIRVANPAKTYYLNNRDLKDDLMKIDYSATIEVKGGSEVTYLTDGGSNDGIYTSKLMNHNFTCPGVPGIPQPFAGQFIYTTVESVTPTP
jgi:hypothetical protein